jgi:hypothetical protein
MDNRRHNELIVFLIRKTGWTLEYITSLPLSKLTTLSKELGYQNETELYRLGSYHAMTAIMQAKKGTRITDFIGQPPRRDPKGKENNLAKTEELSKIVLKDGKEYTLAPLDLNTLVDIEDKFDKPLSELLKEGRLKVIRYILFKRLHPNYPELTEDKLGTLLDFGYMKTLFSAVQG